MKKKDIQQFTVQQSSKENKDEVAVGEKILEWDPFAMPILGEVKGKVVFEEMIVGCN